MNDTTLLTSTTHTMDIITLLLFAIGLCFDSFAVSVSCGMIRCQTTVGLRVRFAAVLGFFQALMPLLGWALAANFQRVIQDYDHWIAFILLLFLGLKMIRESRSQEIESTPRYPFTLRRSAILGVATSIDALIAGVAMAFLPLTIIEGSQLVNIIVAVIIIGIITFAASIIGLKIGRKASSRLGNRAELIGGLILILIGLKVLIEHLNH